MAHLSLNSSKHLYNEFCLLNIFPEITTESQKLTRVELLYTLHQASSIAAPYRLKTRDVTLVQSRSLLRFHQLYTLMCVCTVLCNFTTDIDLCHHNQDTELFHH